ncbi:MAG: hypothetical protein OXN17_09630 [Candidatus Poribacteria bacterium]|nr:hypothetical protein [Candidatus Poribacteria bacterium]MDE0502767.1 hypothetical protein [Candidatus Poribacteria bacterium]
MDDLVQLIPLIIIVLTLLGRVFRRKKPRESEPEVVLEDEQEVTLPPWGNLETMEGNTGFPDFLEQEERSPSPEPAPSLTAAQETGPPPEVTPPKPEKRPSYDRAKERIEAAPVRTAPRTIAGISLTSKTFRQGIILREILGPPKSLQRRTDTEN